MGAAATGGRRSGGRRSATRLAAVQALYEIECTGIPVDGVLSDFLARRWALTEIHGATDDDAGPHALVAPDLRFLEELVRGAIARQAELDRSIQAALDPDGTPLERMETLLRAILRLGAFELAAERSDVDAATIIDEYVELAHAFFAAREPALVNGVLDRLARTLRSGDFHGAEKPAGAG
jgi:N utilization substance protein B